jgi:hypothetical protein
MKDPDKLNKFPEMGVMRWDSSSEDLYVAGKKIRTMKGFSKQLQASGDMLVMVPGEDVPSDRLIGYGINKTKGQHGYTEETLTCYHAYKTEWRFTPLTDADELPAYPIDLIENHPVYLRNAPVVCIGTKYLLESGGHRYKYLMRPEVMESMPIPDSAILEWYAINSDETALIDQVDVYFTVPEYADLVQFAADIGLPKPINNPNLFKDWNYIGVTFVESTMAPIRLKYYHKPDSYKTLIDDVEDWDPETKAYKRRNQ